jgi:hypothetical protein
VASANPSNVLADGGAHLSQLSFSNLTESDGSPVPDGALVLISADNNAANLSGWLASSGGTILDGTPSSSASPYGAHYRVVGVAGGAAQAVYSDAGLTAQSGETKPVKAVILHSSSTGTVIAGNFTPIAVATISLRGITSAVAAGPTTLRLGTTGSVTFSGIKDAAGNTVPDGTNVLVSAENNAANQNGWIGSAGGSIVEGPVSSSTSPYGAHYKVLTVIGGSITVTYSTQGASVGTAHVVVLPGTPGGQKIGDAPLAGSVWTIAVTN